MKKNLPHKSHRAAGFRTTLLFGERATLIDKSHPLWNETTSRDSRQRGIRGYSILPWARICAFSAHSVSVNSTFRQLICWCGTSRTCFLEERSHGFRAADVQGQNWFVPGKENECDVITETEGEGACWFLGLILKLLVVGWVEIDPDPLASKTNWTEFLHAWEIRKAKTKPYGNF